MNVALQTYIPNSEKKAPLGRSRGWVFLFISNRIFYSDWKSFLSSFEIVRRNILKSRYFNEFLNF